MKDRDSVPRMGIAPVIARRLFRRSKSSRRRVVLEVGAPRQVPGGDWACPVRITGLSGVRPTPRAIFGIDALQALVLAMTFAGSVLEAQVPPLVWLGEPGDIGLPQTIPEHLSERARKRVQSTIDRELSRLAKRVRGMSSRSHDPGRRRRRRNNQGR
jgi:hypothetical protein